MRSPIAALLSTALTGMSLACTMLACSDTAGGGVDPDVDPWTAAFGETPRIGQEALCQRVDEVADAWQDGGDGFGVLYRVDAEVAAVVLTHPDETCPQLHFHEGFCDPYCETAFVLECGSERTVRLHATPGYERSLEPVPERPCFGVVAAIQPGWDELGCFGPPSSPTCRPAPASSIEWVEGRLRWEEIRSTHDNEPPQRRIWFEVYGAGTNDQ